MDAPGIHLRTNQKWPVGVTIEGCRRVLWDIQGIESNIQSKHAAHKGEKDVTFDDKRLPMPKNNKEKGLLIFEDDEEVESYNLKDSQQVESPDDASTTSIDVILLPPVRRLMVDEDGLVLKNDAYGIAEFDDEQQSMQVIDIPMHEGAPTNGSLSQKTYGVQNK